MVTAAAGVGDSRARRADIKRVAILAGARRVFLSEGFGSASMDAVAAAAGVSKMTVYRHYRSKEELFADVIADLCGQISDDDLAGRMKSLAPPAALRAFGLRMFEIVFAPETIALHRIVIAEGQRFPALAELFFRSGPQASIDLLSNYLATAVPTGMRGYTDPRHGAEEFLEHLRGYAHMRALLGVKPADDQSAQDERLDRAIGRTLRLQG